MRRVTSILLACVAGGATMAAAPQDSAYQCPAGTKLIGRVCLSADQQTATCLYPDKVGGTPKSGTVQDANPAACPRHPPRADTTPH